MQLLPRHPRLLACACAWPTLILAACGQAENQLDPPHAAAEGGASGGGGGGSTGGGASSGGTGGKGGGAQAAVQLRALGRVGGSAARATLSWPATGLAFATRATQLSAQLTTVLDPVSYVQGGAVAVWVDGVLVKKVVLGKGAGSYPLPPLDGKLHQVSLIKTSEPFAGDILFTGITGGQLEATAAAGPGRLIEFVGDSITAGFGVDGPQGNAAGCASEARPLGGSDPSLSNASLSAPVLTAGALGADWSVIAYSGRGVYRNLSPGADGSELPTVPQLYERVSPDQGSQPMEMAPRTADAVVINLGTNDFSRRAVVSQPQFVAAYSKLLKAVRARHPKAPIVAALGPMLSDFSTTPDGLPMLTTASAYINEAIAASAVAKVSFITIPFDAERVSCDYHPDQAGQQRISDKLVGALRAATGWN